MIEEARVTTKVSVAQLGRVKLLKLDGPDRMNAISVSTMDALVKVLEGIREDRDVGCVVIAGEGNAFSAGGDIKTMHAMTSMSFEQYVDSMQSTQALPGIIRGLPQPVIAAVNGVAAGVGLALAAACDLRVASTSSRFVTSFAKVGFTGDGGISWLLTHLVGPAKARELMILGETVGSADALRIGLVNRVVESADLMPTSMAMASQIASGPTVAYRYIKANLNAAQTDTLADIVSLEKLHQARAFQTDDHREAILAFSERRSPNFTGR